MYVPPYVMENSDVSAVFLDTADNLVLSLLLFGISYHNISKFSMVFSNSAILTKNATIRYHIKDGAVTF
jgi:hypothetical protein